MTDRTAGPAPVPKRILVVDDDALVAMGLVSTLEDLGHDVVEANSGAQALAAIERDAGIALVITDQSMPGMSGTDLARAVAARRPDLPVLLASGYHDVPEGADLGLPLLSKPYDDQAIARAVAAVFGPAAGG